MKLFCLTEFILTNSLELDWKRLETFFQVHLVSFKSFVFNLCRGDKNGHDKYFICQVDGSWFKLALFWFWNFSS